MTNTTLMLKFFCPKQESQTSLQIFLFLLLFCEASVVLYSARLFLKFHENISDLFLIFTYDDNLKVN